MRKTKKYGKYLVLGLLVVAMAVSGISAYFTATDNAINNFDVREVDVELLEPSWVPDLDTDGDGEPDTYSDVTPNETIAKDPTVKNVGTTDQFVFLKVTVPYANIITADLEGHRSDAKNTELFTWNTEDDNGNIVTAGELNAAAGAGTGAVNDGWVLVNTYVNKDTKEVEYIYAYATAKDGEMTALAADASTPTLFDSVTMCNATEDIDGYDSIENKKATVKVNVYAIQTDDLGENSTTKPLDVLKIYFNQNQITASIVIPVTATDSEGNDLNASSYEITGSEKSELLAKLDESGLANAEDVDALIEVESDDFDDLADTTFDVSGIAKEGDTVAILHFNEDTKSWEYIATETVDADGKINADFESYSPVAFVVIKDKIPEGATYIAKDGTVYNAGDAFPETMTAGDVYKYHNYEYGYQAYYDIYGSKWMPEGIGDWNVHCIRDMADPGPILESINGRPITAMSDTFRGYTSLEIAPSIPNTVTRMHNTFWDCTSLKSYSGATSGTANGDFSGYVIPNSVTSMISTFYNCTSLTVTPVIPGTVNSMSSVFGSCTNLTTVSEIQNGVKELCNVFQNCTSLEVAPTIPNTAENISGIFSGCTSLKTYEGAQDGTADGDLSGYVIPNSVTNMSMAFGSCESMVKAPAIPSSVTSIWSAFTSCTSLIATPDLSGCTQLDGMGLESTFEGCTALTTVTGSINNVKSMSRTFFLCRSLTGTITINSNPNSYGSCFVGVDFEAQGLTLAGDSTMLADLGATGSNYQG